MYLEARVSAYRPWGTEADANRKVLEEAAEAVGLPASDNIDYITITREVAYWRKANAIHRWFVETCQGGEDDCRHAYVDVEQLRELRDLCASLLAKRDEEQAVEKLPPQEGFFFGPADIDEWYWDNLANTVKQLDKVLAFPKVETMAFQYHSSW